MARRYDSFVLRCWRLSGEERRVEVEHLQSGGRTRVTALAAAVEWISTQCGDSGARVSGAWPRPAAEEVMSSDDGAADEERTG
jgi:hypothetical protein